MQLGYDPSTWPPTDSARSEFTRMNSPSRSLADAIDPQAARRSAPAPPAAAAAPPLLGQRQARENFSSTPEMEAAAEEEQAQRERSGSDAARSGTQLGQVATQAEIIAALEKGRSSSSAGQ